MYNPLCGPPPTPVAVTDNPCVALPMLRAALYEVLQGKRSQVRFGDQWMSWHKGNENGLRAEIRRLEQMCMNGFPSNAGRAQRVGPIYNPALAYPGRGYRY